VAWTGESEINGLQVVLDHGCGGADFDRYLIANKNESDNEQQQQLRLFVDYALLWLRPVKMQNRDISS